MHAEGGNIFVYMGGGQEVPRNVTHVIIDRSVKFIPRDAFFQRRLLVSVETHDGIEKIEGWAFNGCDSLRGIKLPGVREIGLWAFWGCNALTDVEFSDKLERIRGGAFAGCRSLQKITLPFVQMIGPDAFITCHQMTDVELLAVERIEAGAFVHCPRLRRIVIPLKDNMFTFDTHLQRYDQFDDCENLSTVDIVGGIQKTISSLLLESWKDEMNEEIDRINQDLPNTPHREKTGAIQRWIRSVISRMEHYKAEHNTLLKEDMTQLELAVWKAKLDEDDVDAVSARKERRITSGADINVIISNVLPFLQLLE